MKERNQSVTTGELHGPLRERLSFIEDRLFWYGRISSSDVIRRFGLSKAQAANDVARYRSMQNCPILYDPKLKAFVAPAGFTPIITAQTISRFLEVARHDDLIDQEIVDFAFLQPLTRWVDVQVAREVTMAILNSLDLEVEYSSLSSGTSLKWLAPHALASDGLRVHVRAYDYNRGDFRDFVLGRLRSIQNRRQRLANCDADADWFEIIHLDLIVNPAIPATKKKALHLDYGIDGDVLPYAVRKSMLPYLNSRLFLHSSFAKLSGSERFRHLVPKNQSAFDQLLDSMFDS